MKTKVAIVAGVLLVVLAVFLMIRSPAPVRAGESSAPVTPPPPGIAPSEGGGAAAVPVPAPPTSTPAPSVPAGGNEFTKWFDQEAKSINSRGGDAQVKQAELVRVAQAMTPQEKTYLVAKATSTSIPAGERVLAVYMLTQAGAAPELLELASNPPSVTGPQSPHTENEMRQMQERSLKIMAVDSLLEKAATDPQARLALERAIPGIADPYVREHVTRILADLNRR